jgi:RNA polymerase sigma factor (TIGR02999 family)
MSSTNEVTRLLGEWAKGDQQALEQLMPLVYGELRQIAASYLRKERHGHTLQPTAVVHEAYICLVRQKNPNWEERKHFFGVAARPMRQILVEHARRRGARKRARRRVSLESAVSFQPERSRDVVVLDSCLSELEKLDPRKCKAIELRYFAGLSMDEIGQALDVSPVRSSRKSAKAYDRRRFPLRSEADGHASVCVVA